MEETQAGGIEFEVTYPVAPSYAPFRQKSLGDCTRPLLMGANEGPAWRLMSTLCTIGGRKVQVFTASGSGWFTVPPDETRVGTPMRRSQWSVVFTASGSGWFTVPPDETRVGTPMRRSQWSVVFTASGSGWFTVPPDETRVGTPMRRSQWSRCIYTHSGPCIVYIFWAYRALCTCRWATLLERPTSPVPGVPSRPVHRPWPPSAVRYRPVWR
jgi:hypothetical protein